MLITCDVNLSNLNLLVLVDVYIHDNFILTSRVVTLNNINISILESLIVKVTLDDNLCLIHHIRCYLVTLDKSHLGIEVITFTLLNTIYINL